MTDGTPSTDASRGALYPHRLPEFTRRAPTGPAADLVEWFWIPVWDLPPGAVAPQHTLAYPAANLVVEGDEVTLWGSTTCVARRDLRGRGWAVGALLRPAALAALCGAPNALVDDHLAIDAPILAEAVATRMPGRISEAVDALAGWIAAHTGTLSGEARLANDMARLLMTDATVLRIEDAAERLAVSPRTLQRLAHRTVGLPPAAMIRRRRLQEAAQRVREAPEEPLAAIAADLGYSDQAHLANDFRTVLGVTATEYRAAG